MIQPMPPAGVAVFMILLGSWSLGCGRNRVLSGPPAASIPTISSQPEFETDSPVSVPQRDDILPPLQAIPAEALPRVFGPLALEVQPEVEPEQGERAESTATIAPSHPELPGEPGETAPLPRLGRIVTEEERQTRNEHIDSNLTRATESLRIIRNSGAALDADERAAVKRIQAFVSQVERTRRDDLASAQNLAERARLLAEDLARNLR